MIIWSFRCDLWAIPRRLLAIFGQVSDEFRKCFGTFQICRGLRGALMVKGSGSISGVAGEYFGISGAYQKKSGAYPPLLSPNRRAYHTYIQILVRHWGKTNQLPLNHHVPQSSCAAISIIWSSQRLDRRNHAAR